MEKLIKKSLYRSLKIDHFNDKTIILTNYVKNRKISEKIEKKFLKKEVICFSIYVKIGKKILKNYVKIGKKFLKKL